MTNLEKLPDAARVWIFPLLGPVSDSDRSNYLAVVEQITRNWKSHGQQVSGGADLLHDRFLIIVADEAASGVSGCSIDGIFRSIERLASDHGTPLGDNSLVYFRGVSGISAVPRDMFKQ